MNATTTTVFDIAQGGVIDTGNVSLGFGMSSRCVTVVASSPHVHEFDCRGELPLRTPALSVMPQEWPLLGRERELGYLAEAIAGGDTRARYLLGIELFNAGKLPEAMEQLYAFVATSRLPYRLVPHWLEPPFTEVITARLVLARAASMQGAWERAAEQARLVLAVGPGNRTCPIT